MGVPYQGGVGTSGGPKRNSNQGFGALGGLSTVGNINNNTLQNSIFNFLSSLNTYRSAPAPKAKKAKGTVRKDAGALALTGIGKYLRDKQQHKNIKRDHAIAGQNMRNFQATTGDLITAGNEEKASRGIAPGTGSKTQYDITIDRRNRNLVAAGVNRREARRRWHSQRVSNFLFG